MLTLQIKEKEIENLTPEEEFVRGTVGAKCQINFDEFWQGYEKYIVFKNTIFSDPFATITRYGTYKITFDRDDNIFVIPLAYFE